MITLRNKETQQPIGEISEAQLEFLINQLEEEYEEDQDYAISAMLLDYFEGDGGADPALVSVLRNALGDKEEINIVWSK